MIRILFSLIGFVSLSACSSHAPEIQTFCLRDDIGNYIIKWETSPQLEGTVKLYVSDTPYKFDRSNPATYANIRDGITKYVTEDNITRKYFLLSFNDRYLEKVASRSVAMDSVQNFRDLGGYASEKDRKEIRWGKIFRSGSINSLGDRDIVRLDNLGIKTIIDLRSEEEWMASPIDYAKANIIHIPVTMERHSEIFSRIDEGRIRKGDGVVYMQDMYIQYVEENKEQFAKALSFFEDEDNYPIVFSCSLGKDQVGFLAAMLLAALDIPEETILNDYLASNDYLELSRYASMVQGLNSDAQETLTVLLSANATFLELAFQRIKKEHGSLKEYLAKELHISEKQQNKLKEILLF